MKDLKIISLIYYLNDNIQQIYTEFSQITKRIVLNSKTHHRLQN